MFTGIVTDVGELVAVEDHQGSLRRLTIHSAYPADSIAMGASIATGGPCLTVTGFGPRPGGGSWYTVDAAAETLARTTVTGGLTLLSVLAIALFGGEALRGFAIALSWGIVIGTYSSIFVAAPMLIYMHLHGIRAKVSTAPADTVAASAPAKPK